MEVFTRWLGDSPFDVVLNGLVIAIVCYFAYRIVLEPVFAVVSRAWNAWKLRGNGAQSLEIIPPAQIGKSPAATQQLFTVIQRLLAGHGVMSLELVASRNAGIRYVVRARSADLAPLQRHLASYLPELRFRLHDRAEPLPETTENGAYTLLHELKFGRHYAYPLQAHDDLTESDPAAFIAGSMAKLKPSETVVMQLVVSPFHSYWANRLANKLHRKGYAVVEGRFKHFLLQHWWVWIVAGLIGYYSKNVRMTASWAIILLAINYVIMFVRPSEEPELTEAQQELYRSMLDKLNRPLFRADIRVFMRADDTDRLRDLQAGLNSSLAPLNVPGFQQLTIPRFNPIGNRLSRFKFQRRLPSLFAFRPSILDTSELASIYHFPHGLIETEGMVRSHSRTLPAPLSLKNDPELDVVIGMNKHHGTDTPIGLTEAERERHMFVVGGTGSGKTTMLKYQLVQDIRNGKGLAVIDPHGDLAEELLEYIPEARKKDLIYLNPDDLEHPLGVNLLELPAGLTGNDLLREKDRVTESVISIMRKVFSEDDSGGHRIEYVLRNATQTALTLEKPTLFTIFQLLNDGKFAKDAVKNLEDENLKLFWKDELGKAGSMQKVKMTAGITAKIGRFLFSASARAMLEQEKSMIDFDEVLDGKILICNFSKGKLGEDTSMLFGVTVLAKLQLAALKRAERKQKDRKRFYIYVDEFQNFATLSFTQMLSEARKYRVFLTMAEQSTQQQDDQKLVDIILANVGTVVTFRTGSPKDEEYLLPLFLPYIQQGEISNLPAYNFYCRIAGLTPEEPMSGETIQLDS
ncbi:DUF87 domain-containing protein [Candidatus Saccharibacteria bacterium]|nr:MAG: DUF87 domain-containing protein [Candidatus Saccharibacteria bacterium]